MRSLRMHRNSGTKPFGCGVPCSICTAAATVRLLPAIRGSQQSATSSAVSQLADDLNIIDSLFETATIDQASKKQRGSTATGSKQHASSTAATISAQQPARKPPSLPQLSSQMPWDSETSSTIDAPQQTSRKVLQQLKLKRAGKQAATQQSNSSSSREGSNRRSRQPSFAHSSSISSRKPLYRALNALDLGDVEFTNDTAFARGGLEETGDPAPVNPWLKRQQQLAKHRVAAAAAAADRKRQETAEQSPAEQQQLLPWHQQRKQLLQQQQQHPSQPTSMQTMPGGTAADSNIQKEPRLQPGPQTTQLPQSNVQQAGQLCGQQSQAMQTGRVAMTSSSSTLTSPRGSSSTTTQAAGSPVLQQPCSMPQRHRQNVSTMRQAQLPSPPATGPEQHEQGAGLSQEEQVHSQQAAAADEGIVRSARRLRMQRRQSVANSLPQQQKQQANDAGFLPAGALQQTAAAGAGTGVLASALTVASNIGQSPLVVLGGQAAGSQVIWTEQASIAVPASLQDAAATPQDQQQEVPLPSNAVARVATSQLQSPVQQRSAGTAPSAAAQSQVGQPTASVAGGRRLRRGRLLQGMAGIPPPVSDFTVAAVTTNEAANWTAAPAAADSLPTATTCLSSSSRSVTGLQELQQQLSKLDNNSWQLLAGDILPDLYDPSWHSSLYTFMQDVWQAVLSTGAARPPRRAAANSCDHSSNLQSPAIAWALTCLQHNQRHMWASALLALVDCLAGDDSAGAQLAVQAVHVLPAELLEQLVLPAAEIMDHDVYGVLQQQHQQQHQLLKKQQGCVSGSAAAAVAAPSLLGPAPWAVKKQQQQQQGSSKLIGQEEDRAVLSIQAPITAAASKDVSTVTVAASGHQAEPGLGQVPQMLQELQQLQRLYPGVHLAALSHIAPQHGLWCD